VATHPRRDAEELWLRRHYPVAIRQQRTPSQFSDDDLSLWGQGLLNQGRSYLYVQKVKSEFRRCISKSGLAVQLPKFCCASRSPSRYGVPLRCFPVRLRREVDALLAWKQDVYAEGRPREGRHRAETASQLEGVITRLYGYVTTVKKRKNVTRLVELVTKKWVASFIKWNLNDRRVKGEPIANRMGLLNAALKWNPAYKSYVFSWFGPLLSGIPRDSESEKRERKESKYLPYEMLESIPAMIRARGQEIADTNRWKAAFLVHDELLFMWLVTLVWRQRNIRECQIGHNVFKAEIPALVDIAVPRWAQERLNANPREEFWQFHFREDETKTHREVRSILPRRLVPLLEEYLEHYRPLLLRGFDPTNLFLNRRGHPFNREKLAGLVSNLTVRYGHRRVTPHVFRDSFAFYWLKHHSRDYLTVSKALWHADIETTIRIYGSKFNESQALCQIEEWLDSRDKEPEHLPQPAIEGSVDSGKKTLSKLSHVQPPPEKDLSVFHKGGYGTQSELPFVLEEPQSAKPLSSVLRNKRSGGIAV
jgi:integrase